jgi:hypothetical protein
MSFSQSTVTRHIETESEFENIQAPAQGNQQLPVPVNEDNYNGSSPSLPIPVNQHFNYDVSSPSLNPPASISGWESQTDEQPKLELEATPESITVLPSPLSSQPIVSPTSQSTLSKSVSFMFPATAGLHGAARAIIDSKRQSGSFSQTHQQIDFPNVSNASPSPFHSPPSFYRDRSASDPAAIIRIERRSTLPVPLLTNSPIYSVRNIHTPNVNELSRSGFPSPNSNERTIIPNETSIPPSISNVANVANVAATTIPSDVRIRTQSNEIISMHRTIGDLDAHNFSNVLSLDSLPPSSSEMPTLPIGIQSIEHNPIKHDNSSNQQNKPKLSNFIIPTKNGCSRSSRTNTGTGTGTGSTAGTVSLQRTTSDVTFPRAHSTFVLKPSSSTIQIQRAQNNLLSEVSPLEKKQVNITIVGGTGVGTSRESMSQTARDSPQININ